MYVLDPLPKKIRNQVYRCDNRPVLESTTGDSDYSKDGNCSRNDIRGPLDIQLCYPVDDTYEQLSAIYFEVLSSHLRQASNSAPDDYGIPPTDEWAGGVIHANNPFPTPSICR